MVSRVVSTKLSEEEYGKLVGLCGATGFTVSKLLKRAILERMKEEPITLEKPAEKIVKTPEPSQQKRPKIQTVESNDRFLYY